MIHLSQLLAAFLCCLLSWWFFTTWGKKLRINSHTQNHACVVHVEKSDSCLLNIESICAYTFFFRHWFHFTHFLDILSLWSVVYFYCMFSDIVVSCCVCLVHCRVLLEGGGLNNLCNKWVCQEMQVFIWGHEGAVALPQVSSQTPFGYDASNYTCRDHARNKTQRANHWTIWWLMK